MTIIDAWRGSIRKTNITLPYLAFIVSLDITEEQPERFSDEDYPFCTLDTENEEDESDTL